MTTKIKKGFLIFGDIAVLYISLYLALVFRYQGGFDKKLWQDHFLPFTIVYTVWLFIFYLAGLYNPQTTKNNLGFFSTLLKALVIAAFISIAIFYMIPFFNIAPKTNLALDMAIFAALFTIWRQGYNSIAKNALTRNVLFLGENKESLELAEILRSNPQIGYKVAGVLKTGSEEELKNVIKERHINIIVHAKEASREENFSGILYALIPLGITVYDLPRFYADITRKVPISIVGRTWFLENLIESEKGIYETAKRSFDIFFSIVIGIIVLPFFPLIMLAIKLNSKGSAFYTQTRIGKNGKIIKLLKFRTMFEDAEKNGVQWTLEKDARVTKIGNILRRSRIDELPQLWNILRGDLSFIGPRPERPEFVRNLEAEIPHYQIRHLIRPGLTGWAQINQPLGSASVKDSTEKLQYDLYYIKNRTLVIDLDIIAKTIMVVLKREGH